MSFTREDKYLVLKREDITKYLSPDLQYILEDITDRISAERSKEGKETPSFVVVKSKK